MGNPSRPLVIFHQDCQDGFAAAFAAWLALGDEAEYLPVRYGQIFADEMTACGSIFDRDVYILDFSFPRPLMERIFAQAKRVVWRDHHKTAFEAWCPGEYERWQSIVVSSGEEPHDILLDNSKSGALLAWEYFHPGTEVPMLIQHIDDRDRWQWKLRCSAEIHAALGSMKPWSFEQWQELILPEHYGSLCTEGAAILRAQDANIQSMLKQARECCIQTKLEDTHYVADFHGLALNTPMHMSEVGHELAKQSGTYGLVYYLGADNKVKCSLRSEGNYDVSAIAKAFGGGGHRNAAAFETDINTLMGWLK